jgi:hypothetical protein
MLMLGLLRIMIVLTWLQVLELSAPATVCP